MKKSGLADSPFFQPAQSENTAAPPPFIKTAAQKIALAKIKKENKTKVVEPKSFDTVIPRHQATTQPRYHDTMTPPISDVIVGLVRKAVKEFGKEAATHRFTVAEKKELADLIYTYKNRGIKTSENEITRIAVNFVVEDYKENGERSVLHKILEALNG